MSLVQQNQITIRLSYASSELACQFYAGFFSAQAISFITAAVVSSGEELPPSSSSQNKEKTPLQQFAPFITEQSKQVFQIHKQKTCLCLQFPWSNSMQQNNSLTLFL